MLRHIMSVLSFHLLPVSLPSLPSKRTFARLPQVKKNDAQRRRCCLAGLPHAAQRDQQSWEEHHHMDVYSSLNMVLHKILVVSTIFGDSFSYPSSFGFLKLLFCSVSWTPQRLCPQATSPSVLHSRRLLRQLPSVRSVF